jgi:hypothetical protein
MRARPSLREILRSYRQKELRTGPNKFIGKFFQLGLPIPRVYASW